MGFNCGIIGLSNVGKSTLFNALTESNKAVAANYPFSTIKPNIGRVSVPDERLKILSEIRKSEKTIPAYIDSASLSTHGSDILVTGYRDYGGLEFNGTPFIGVKIDFQVMVD